MATKKFTQYGLIFILVLGVFFFFFLIAAYHAGLHETVGLEYGLLAALMLLVLLFMYRIVIEINEDTISFRLGIGVFRRTYKLSNLISCKPVRNSFLMGFGIRKIADGWLYNVGGLDAIELAFDDRDNVVRIGTNRAKEITELITSLMPNKQPDDEHAETKRSFSIDKEVLFIVAVALIILGNVLYDMRDSKFNLDKDKLEITNSYSKSINYRDIAKMDTIIDIPSIAMKTNGLDASNLLKGYFRLTNDESAYLNLHTHPPYIRLILKTDQYILINMEDANKTRNLYRELATRVSEVK
jgi:hypothetical protein